MSIYDGLNRVIETINAQLNATKMRYDGVGNLLALTDARGNITEFAYDTMNRVESRTDSKGKTEFLTYDFNSNLKSFTDRRGQSSTFDYDQLNRLTHKQYEDGSIVNRTYYPRGLLLEADDSIGGAFTFSYDLAGRLLSSAGPFGSISYDRYKLGRVENRQVLGQDVVDYNYDPVGNLLSAAMPQVSITSSYDKRNQLKQQVRSNGVTTDYTYDGAARLATISHVNTSVMLESLIYNRDAVGNIIGKESINPQAFTSQPSNFEIEVDSNRLTQRANVSYTHDENGNRLTESGPQGVKTYSWDSRNRLKTISTPNGLTQNFHYDFSGNLIEQKTQGQGINDVKQYVLDDLTNVVLQENNNFEQLSVLTGRSIDQHLATTKANGKVEFALSDSINSTVLTTDENGSVAGEFSYDPFGATASAGSEYSYQFTGRVPVLNDFYYIFDLFIIFPDFYTQRSLSDGGQHYVIRYDLTCFVSTTKSCQTGHSYKNSIKISCF